MTAQPPAYLRHLRRALDTIEPRAARAWTTAINSPEVSRALLEVGRVRHKGENVAHQLRDEIAHLLDLPSQGDVRALSRALARVESALAEIEAQIEESRDDG